jgi:hypothetical protein
MAGDRDAGRHAHTPAEGSVLSGSRTPGGAPERPAVGRLAQGLSARIDYYRQETSNARAVAIEKAASLLRRRHQILGAAARVLAELRKKGIEAPPGLAEVADAAMSASDAELARMEAAVQGALALLERHRTEEEKREADSRLAAIAEGYAPAAGAFSIAEWLATHPGEESPLLSDRLTRLISEIEGWGRENASRPLLERAAAIAKEIDPGHRALLEDSLVIEVEEIRARQRRLQEVRARLNATLASLAAFYGEEAEKWRREIAATLAGDDEETAALVAARAAAWRAEAAAREEADARRKAVLESLALLGYEVREGMAAVRGPRGAALSWRSHGRPVMAWSSPCRQTVRPCRPEWWPFGNRGSRMGRACAIARSRRGGAGNLRRSGPCSSPEASRHRS